MELSEIVVGGLVFRRVRLSTWVRVVGDVQGSLSDDMSVCLDEIVQLRHDNAIMGWELGHHDKENNK